MDERPTQAGRVRRRHPTLDAAALVLAIAACAISWSGCAVEKNYKLLSFFFDGVPDPSKSRATPSGPLGGIADPKSSPTYSAHKPYVQEQCSDCHAGRLQMSRKDSSICLKCHANQTSQYERMHGPVAAAACLWCHSPHESAFAKLLKGEARLVCGQCHEPERLTITRAPEHADAARSCLECHSGHGGTRPFMLLTQPAESTTPAPEPPTQDRP